MKIKMMKKKPVFKLNMMTCLVIVTVIASVTMIAKGIMLQPAIAANRVQAAQLRDNIEYENQRIAEIDSMTEKVGTDEYIEKIAREKLGMIKADEIVFVDISGQ